MSTQRVVSMKSRFSHQMRSVTRIDSSTTQVRGVSVSGLPYTIDIVNDELHPGAAFGWCSVLRSNRAARNHTRQGSETI